MNNQCSGSHGISIESVGGRSDNVVQGVTVSGFSVTNYDNGIRIKTVNCAAGKVNSITFEDITMENITKYGVVIEGDYLGSESACKTTGGVPITNLILKTVIGTVKSAVQDIYILVEDASFWTWSGVDITGSKVIKKFSGVSSGLSATCRVNVS